MTTTKRAGHSGATARPGHAARDDGVFDKGEPALRGPAVEDKPSADHAQTARDRVRRPCYRSAQTDVHESHKVLQPVSGGVQGNGL
jgi:hypothetical protein